ncbi:hypothetical protein ABZV77_01730 [Streptomyces sp. NPDC004732]|uniref:hypothetical protein n=1 Tax=Streptomyces sp. NPDC004732 TaxID=3154290 RepID=UPI0033BB9FFD
MQGTPHIASTPHDGRWSSTQPCPPHTAGDAPPRMPHRTVAARAAPMTQRPEAAAAPQLPVFIDESGWRRRTLQGMALLVGCGCLGYLLFAGTLISDLGTPVGTHPPSTTGTDTRNVPAPGAPAGNDGHHRKPPSGRSVQPPAGDAAQ